MIRWIPIINFILGRKEGISELTLFVLYNISFRLLAGR